MTACCWVAMYGRGKEAGDDGADDATDDVGKDDDGGNNGDDDADGDDEEDAAMIAVLTFAGTPPNSLRSAPSSASSTDFMDTSRAAGIPTRRRLPSSVHCQRCGR